MFLGGAVMIAGLIVIGWAWSQIHDAGGELVTSGLHSRMRHPQYFGLFLITVGMFIQWPTIVTAAMWPALMFMYYKLAVREEEEMGAIFGERYMAYKHEVPMFLPRIRISQTNGLRA